MEAIYLMLPLSVLLGSIFLAAFILASKKGQFEDLETPAMRIIIDDDQSNQERTHEQ